MNLPNIKRQVSYVQFLNEIPLLHQLPKQAKLNGANFKQYEAFVTDLLHYLVDFHERVYPLVDRTEVGY